MPCCSKSADHGLHLSGKGATAKGLVCLCVLWRDACEPGNAQPLLLPSVRCRYLLSEKRYLSFSQ